MYERPMVQRLGTLRSLTQFGYGGQNDLIGIWLNNTPIGPAAPDGCGSRFLGYTGPETVCRGS